MGHMPVKKSSDIRPEKLEIEVVPSWWLWEDWVSMCFNMYWLHEHRYRIWIPAHHGRSNCWQTVNTFENDDGTVWLMVQNLGALLEM